MQGPLAQMIALACHGNAAIAGKPRPSFFPDNSTCEFCEFAKFIAGGEAATFAETPDEWLALLPKRGISGLRLHQRAQNHPGISDRNSSGFVGGGRLWRIEGLRNDGTSEFWLSKWEVGDRQAADRRIWRVTYGLLEVSPTAGFVLRPLDAISADLRAALNEIRVFAEANDCGNFVRCFDDALRALGDPQAAVGYHKDLFAPDTLDPAAQSLLKAAQVAWVFGGMGSSNDMGFSGETQKAYERVSDKLFDLLNDAIEAAATSSQPAN